MAVEGDGFEMGDRVHGTPPDYAGFDTAVF